MDEERDKLAWQLKEYFEDSEQLQAGSSKGSKKSAGQAIRDAAARQLLQAGKLGMSTGNRLEDTDVIELDEEEAQPEKPEAVRATITERSGIRFGRVGSHTMQKEFERE